MEPSILPNDLLLASAGTRQVASIMEYQARSSVEVSPQDLLKPVVGVEGQAEEVQIAL